MVSPFPRGLYPFSRGAPFRPAFAEIAKARSMRALQAVKKVPCGTFLSLHALPEMPCISVRQSAQGTKARGFHPF